MQGEQHILDTWMNMRNLNRQEIMQKLSAGQEHVQFNLKYEKLAPVDKIHNPEKHPGHFYFQGDRLVMLYVGQGEEIGHLKMSRLIKKFGQPVELDSRAGKFPHYVFPKKGFACSADGEQILFIEIFPPCTLEYYLEHIYEQPIPFRK